MKHIKKYESFSDMEDDLDNDNAHRKEKPLKERIKDVMYDAQWAFWAVVAEKFPEAKYGDFAPDQTIAFDRACETAITQWVDNNVIDSDEDAIKY